MREDHYESAGGSVKAADDRPDGGSAAWWVRDGDVLVAGGAGADPGRLAGLAGGLASDREHVMVVVGGEVPSAGWAQVADVLGGSSRGVRLVPGDAGAGSLVGAGVWLSGRLGRVVLVPDGVVARAPGGGLFVGAGHGRGWMRVRPGEKAVAGSRRFPVPAWAGEALERVSVLSDGAVAEPLPGGAWIRPPAGAAVAGYRRWLVSRLAWRDDRVFVVLGHPGAAPVAAADVVTFWGLLPEWMRALVRFVPYGPVAGGGPAGQVLAGWLGVPVGVVAGVPLGGRGAGAGARVRAVRADGAPGWEPFAQEMWYCPAGPGAKVPEPTVLVCRPPVAGLAETGPGVYECGPGIVAEVVQGGVWLRPPGPAPDPAPARVRPLAADEPLVFVDETLAAGGRRPAVTGLLNALEPAVRASFRLVRVPPLAAARPAPAPGAAPSPATSAAPEPPAVPSPGAPEAAVPDPRPAAVPAAPPASLTAPASPAAAVTEPQAAQLPPPPPAQHPAIRLESGPSGQAAAQATPEVSGRQSGSLAAENIVPVEADSTANSARPPTEATGSTGPGEQNPASAKARGPWVQVVPERGACVVPPPEGLAQERAWLRRTMSRQHDAAASLVGRVLAENPGIRGQDGTPTADLLTDLAALRVYLSGTPQSLDDAIRTAKAGPHVPYGRCVAAGLRRMPSYRGATRLRATLADAEWQWYQSRDVVTEWAFCAAVTSGRLALPGTVEFRIWSATARRTKLLESLLPGQVLFLPGTSFKVLQVGTSENKEVLLRELSAHEIGSDGRVELGRVPLDEVALTGLEHGAAAWRAEGSSEDLPAGYEHRFGNPPGLIVKRGTSAGDPASKNRASTP